MQLKKEKKRSLKKYTGHINMLISYDIRYKIDVNFILHITCYFESKMKIIFLIAKNIDIVLFYITFTHNKNVNLVCYTT